MAMGDPTAPPTLAVCQLAPQGGEFGPPNYSTFSIFAPRLVDEGYLLKGPQAASNSSR